MRDCNSLDSIPAELAFQNEAANPWSYWPDRGGDMENRVEPFCLPQFAAPFTISPGSSVFTIGSCFARNVERSLIGLGFDIPLHRALSAGVPPTVLNNYTAPSMLNEVSWALDPSRPYDQERNFYQVDDRKVADLHLGARWSYPTDLATARARRQRVHDGYQALRHSQLLILTLGLAEAWYDSELDLYLNSAPMKRLIERYPGRFFVRVLSHRFITESIGRLIELAAAKNTVGGLKCVLTVSPVPLMLTFRPGMDVITANAYSKSVLRAAAEEISCGFDNVAYFPSYESITLSDRHETWEDDQTHVRQKLIDINISRMVATYVRQDQAAIESPDILAQLAQTKLDEKDLEGAIDLAERALAASPDHERAFVVKVVALGAQRQGKAKALELALSRYAGAAEEFLAEHTPFDLRQRIARWLLGLGRAETALAVIRKSVEIAPSHMPSHILMGDILAAQGDKAAAAERYRHCLTISNRVGLPYYKLAQLELELGNREVARNLIEVAITISRNNPAFVALREEMDAAPAS